MLIGICDDNAMDAGKIRFALADVSSDIELRCFGSGDALLDGDSIRYGAYPQTHVTDAAQIELLDQVRKTWQSCRYSSGTGDTDGRMSASDYMRYADLYYKGPRYRAVTFDRCRPSYSSEAFDDSQTRAKSDSRCGRQPYNSAALL